MEIPIKLVPNKRVMICTLSKTRNEMETAAMHPVRIGIKHNKNGFRERKIMIMSSRMPVIDKKPINEISCSAESAPALA